MNEKDLLVSFKAKKEALEQAKEAQKAAQSEYDMAEKDLIEHLNTIGADATASYDGLGYAKMSKPTVYASCLKENEDNLKDTLRKMGRGDLIRETINPRSLSALVKELIEAGQEPPAEVNYYLKTSIRVY